MRTITRAQLVDYRLLQGKGTGRGRYGRGFLRNKTAYGTLDHQDLNSILPFNPTAENIARWICDRVPHCYKVDVQESANNIATYECDK